MIIPAVVPAYVTGAITAAGGAWNATIVAEIVTYKGRVLAASGLGTFITEATAHNDFHQIIAGILVMSVYVSGLNALLWRRLYAIAESKYALA
jgi:NitT/TauT family transport system permease protein